MASIYYKIRNNDVEGLKILLEEEPGQINKPIEYGKTPLIFACKVGIDRRILEILLEAGGEVRTKDQWGNTALHYAVSSRRLQAVELLLSRGSEVNGKNNSGYTPLHLAANLSPEWTDGVKELMKHSAVEVNARSNDGQTPLHCTCSRGNFHTVVLLLGHDGIDANVMNMNGDTPLHLAVRGQCYGVVSLLLNQRSVQFDIQNKKKMTPLLEAVSRGHLGIIHRLIALGASINAVDGEGNSCLHLAVGRKVFDSEGAPLDLLNECCTALDLKIKERLSGIVVASYLASQGADFHHKNNKNNKPLDLITVPIFRQKLETFLPPQCLLCRNKAATTKVHPCEHLLTCEECSNIPLQQCLKCLKPVMTSRGRVGAPKFEDRCVQTEATCQELGAASQAIGAPEFEDRCVQTEATCQELGAASQAIESPVLKERDLLRVAKRLGRDWWQVAIFLGVDTTELKIDDESIDAVKQGYLMLREWFKNCDPETRTHATLSAALEEAECFAAMECLSLDAK